MDCRNTRKKSSSTLIHQNHISVYTVGSPNSYDHKLFLSQVCRPQKLFPIKSRIYLPWIKAFCVQDINSPITFIKLFARTLARILYTLPMRLMGLKSLTFMAPTFFFFCRNKGYKCSMQTFLKTTTCLEVFEKKLKFYPSPFSSVPGKKPLYSHSDVMPCPHSDL